MEKRIDWKEIKKTLAVKENPYEEYSKLNLFSEWEKSCSVPPVKIALIHLNKPFDLAYAAQLSLASVKKETPHIGFYMVGKTMDFMYPKILGKIKSWNIDENDIKWIPRIKSDLKELKKENNRLIGTSPHASVDALNFEWKENDILVIGGANGLSNSDQKLMDTNIALPCSEKVPFLTVPVVLPILSYNILNQRGLWKK
jgi:hypothetical protein